MGRENLRIKWWTIGLGIGIACQVLLLAVSLPGQRVQGDEAAFAEFAYWQAEVGHLRSDLFFGLLHYEDRILIYHKLFQWLGAGTVEVFGFHLWPLRALSLSATAVLIILLWRFFRRSGGISAEVRPGHQLEFLLSAAFVLLAPLTFKFAKYYRPEMIQAAMGLGGFLALRRAVAQQAPRWALAAGALAGAAMLTHLNGVVYVLSGAGLLLFRRQFRLTMWYGLAATAAFSLFFLDIVGRWDLFWQQYAGDPTFGEGERTIGGTLGKLLDEHKRLFRKPEIIFTSALFIIACLTNLVYQRRRLGDLLMYTALAIITLGALAPAKTTPYAVLLFPFFALHIAELGAGVIRRDFTLPRSLRAALAVAAVAFVGHSIAADAVNAVTDKQDWVGDNRRAAQVIPLNARVLAPLDFPLTEIGNFQILGLRVPHWRLCEWSPEPYTFDRLVRYADSMKVEAIILDRDERRWLVAYPETVGDVTGPYRLVEKFGDDGLWVWRRVAR